MKISLSLTNTKRFTHPLVIVPLITLLAFALRVHQLGNRSLWYDELLELDVAQGPFSQILPELTRYAAMPLDYFLLHGWIKLGRQEAWVRFPALFFGVLSIPLIYILGRHLFNRRVGYLAALLLTFSSFAVTYSQETRPYALLLFTVMVAYLGLWRAYQTGQKRYWGLFGLGLTGAILSHYFALFMLLPMGLFVIGQQAWHLKEKKFWQHTAFFSVALMGVTLVLILTGRLPVLYSVGQRFIAESYQLDKYTRPAEEKLNRGTGPPLETEFFEEKIVAPLSTTELPALVLYNFFLIIAVLSLFKPSHKNRAAILLLLGWLLLPILLVYIFLLYRGTFYAVRYILYTLPAYLLLVAYGTNGLVRFLNNVYSLWRTKNYALRITHYDKAILPAALTILLLTPLLLAEIDQLQTLYASEPYEDWRAVAQILYNDAAPDDAVIAVKAEPAINWYYPAAGTPYGTYSRSQPIWEAMNRHKRRWFVLSSYSFKQDEGLRDWLQRQGAVKIVIDRRIVLYFHEEGLSKAAMLAQVKQFALPRKEGTYQSLADQYKEIGDVETGQSFDRLVRVLLKGEQIADSR